MNRQEGSVELADLAAAQATNPEPKKLAGETKTAQQAEVPRHRPAPTPSRRALSPAGRRRLRAAGWAAAGWSLAAIAALWLTLAHTRAAVGDTVDVSYRDSLRITV